MSCGEEQACTVVRRASSKTVFFLRLSQDLQRAQTTNCGLQSQTYPHTQEKESSLSMVSIINTNLLQSHDLFLRCLILRVRSIVLCWMLTCDRCGVSHSEEEQYQFSIKLFKKNVPVAVLYSWACTLHIHSRVVNIFTRHDKPTTERTNNNSVSYY
jgi:hypothetical protein